MSDKTMNEDDDEDLIPVETQPRSAAADDNVEDGDDDDGDDDAGDAGDGDARLAQSEDDSEDDITGTNRKRRQKRRDVQRRAKDAAQRKIVLLEQQNGDMLRRLAAIEGRSASNDVLNIDQRIAQTQNEIRQAEHIIAKATEAGNGDDVVAAMRLRDQAMGDAQQLSYVKQQYEQSRQQSSQPQVNPAVAGYAKQWLDANAWYDPQGGDRDSALTKAIDNEITKEGFNPAQREYWEELTSRVAEAIGGSEVATSRPKRKAPPTGNTREHAPVSTKREIYVTPERKQAMIEAGVWDDPKSRQRYLKAYQSYDASSAR